MLTVYVTPVSLYCAKLRTVMRHKRARWQEVPPPGGYGSKTYKRIVPSGNLPALVDGDLVIADSEAIAEYLNEKYPDPPMLPDDLAGRAKARERSRFHDTRLEPEVRALFAWIRARPEDPATVSKRAQAISMRLGQFAAMLEAVPNGAMLTLGDCGYPVTFEWIAALDPIMGLGIDWPDAVVRYRETVCRHEAVAAELASYRPVLDAWLEETAA